MISPLTLSTARASRAAHTRSALLGEAERDLEAAVLCLRALAEGAHWTEQFRLSGLVTKIKTVARAVQTEREDGEEGCLSITCRRCSVEMEGPEYAECCEDADCPMQESNR